MSQKLDALHEQVPPDYYDEGMKRNIMQRLWHLTRFHNLRNFGKKPEGRVLDIGCHSGLFTQEILKRNRFIDIYGIDISRSAIAYAKKRIKKGHFYQGDAHTLPFRANFFDALYCLEMLEHVEQPKQVVLEMKRVLKRKGHGVILIPTDSKLFAMIWSLWNRYSRVWNHTHIQNFNEDSLSDLLTNAGLRITRRKKTHCNMLLLIEFTK